MAAFPRGPAHIDRTGEGGPIFVIGYQRSGTTLLQSMLGAHAAIVGPPEIYFFTRVAPLAGRYGDLRDDDRLRLVIRDTIDTPLRPFDAYALDEERVLRRVAPSRTYGDVLRAVMDEVAAAAGKRRWSDKSPGERAAHVVHHVPDAQLLHIVRDPRDVVASAMAAPWFTDGARRIATMARRHLLETIEVGARLGPRQYLMVRYEDLTADPEAVLRRVCHFLGEDFDRAMLDPSARSAAGTVVDAARPWQSGVAEEVTRTRQGTWRTRLGRLDHARVSAVVHGELAVLGYERASTRVVRVGKVLNAVALPRDAALHLGDRRAARQVRRGGPEVLEARLRAFVDGQMARVGAAP